VLENGTGFVNHYFVGTSDEPAGPRYQLVAKAFVDTVLDDANPLLNFGMVDADTASPTKSITLTSREVANLRIDRILSSPEYFDVSIEKDGRTVDVRSKAGIPWGLHDDVIELKINAPQQSQERIKVRMDVHGAVVPAENPVNVGLMHQGQEHETLIRLTSKTGENFKIGALRTQALDAKVEAQRCTPDDKGCRLLKLAFNGTQPLGEVKGQVLVDLPEYGKTLPIFVWGMLVSPTTEVRTIGDEKDKDPLKLSSSQFAQSTSAARPVSIPDAIKKAVSVPQDTPPAAGRGPLLKWSVASEEGIHGYVIYRAETEMGASTRVNAETIVSSSEHSESSSYQWRDNTAESGKTYWYSIGIVYNDGRKQQLTGPQKVIAK
jgi:hypothetical protein